MLRRRARHRSLVLPAVAAFALACLLAPFGAASPAAADVKLAVTVLFDDGSGPVAVPSATVRISHSEHGVAATWSGGARTANAAGTVEVRSFDNYQGYDFHVRAEAPGGEVDGHIVVPTYENDVVDARLAEPRTVPWRSAYSYTPITITLRPTAALTGSVQTASGSSARDRVTVIAYRENASGDWVPVAQTRTASSGAFAFDSLPIGRYVVETRSATGSLAVARTFHPGVASADDATVFTLTSDATVPVGTVVAPAWDVDTERVYGADRYATSVAVSKAMKPAGGPIFQLYIASGESFADALSAAPVAGSSKSPLLLTPKNSLPSATAAELRRLEPEIITVVGGTAVISRSVERRIQDIADAWGGEVSRVAGADRYETSAQLITSGAWRSPRDRIVIATGRNFADALSAAAAAGSERMPVLLVDGSASSFSQTTLDALESYAPSLVYVAGGHSAVSALAVNRWDREYGLAMVTRFSGADRFETGELINDFFFDTNENALIANGLSFPDALGAAPLAVSLGGPLHLSLPTCVRPELRALLLEQGSSSLTLVGGPSALTGRVEALRTC
jgi:putative cell wall-binding protein